METSKKWYTCDSCAKKLSSYHSLWRHKKICGSGPSYKASHHHIHSFNVDDSKRLAVKRPFDVMYNGAEKETESTNPKIQSLLDAVINDSSSPQVNPKNILPIISQNTVPPNSPSGIVAEVISEKVLPNQPPEIVAAVFQEKPELIADIMPLVKSKPRTKGFSDAEDGGSDSDDSVSDDESIDISDIKPKMVKFLPATIEGLCDRFHTLWTEFTRQGKHNNRNEIVFLLDELLRQEGITREEYTKLNNILAESVGSGIEAAESPKEEEATEIPEYEEAESSKEEEDETADSDDNNGETLKKLIQSTFEYLIQPDKKELMELIKEFRQDADALDTANELEELIDVYLLDEFIDEEPIITKLDAVGKQLETSSPSISKLKQLRMKMLLEEIARNRYRVQSIMRRTADAMGQKEEMAFILKRLAREELLSDEQYLKLAQLDIDDINSSRLANIIKETKIGQGIKFLPRKLSDLTKQLQISLEELAKSGASAVRNKVRAVLEELFRQKGITQDRYNSIKDENDIL